MELLDGKTKTKRSPNEEVVEEVEEEKQKVKMERRKTLKASTVGLHTLTPDCN